MDEQKQFLDFKEWFAEFKRLMIEEFDFPAGKPDSFYGDDESRRDMFESGMDPLEALTEELQDAERLD